MYKTLIFDLDDTLLDFKAGERHGLEQIFLAHGLDDLTAANAQYQIINQAVWQQVEHGADRTKLLNTRFAKLFAEFGQAVDGQKVELEYRHYLDTNYAQIPDAQLVLANLHAKGYRILAGTNGVKLTQERRLAASGLAPYFAAIYTSEEIGYAKPAKEFFQYIFQHETQLSLSDTVMIGDGLSADIQGAQIFGLDRIWVNLKKQSNTSTFKPTQEIQRLVELMEVL